MHYCNELLNVVANGHVAGDNRSCSPAYLNGHQVVEAALNLSIPDGFRCYILFLSLLNYELYTEVQKERYNLDRMNRECSSPPNPVKYLETPSSKLGGRVPGSLIHKYGASTKKHPVSGGNLFGLLRSYRI